MYARLRPDVTQILTPGGTGTIVLAFIHTHLANIINARIDKRMHVKGKQLRVNKCKQNLYHPKCKLQICNYKFNK